MNQPYPPQPPQYPHQQPQPQYQQPFQQPQYQQPPPLPQFQQAYPSNANHPARGTATAAFWLAVLGLFCFPIVPSILAWVLADNATRAGYPGGRARAARVLAGLALLVDAAALVVYRAARRRPGLTCPGPDLDRALGQAFSPDRI